MKDITLVRMLDEARKGLEGVNFPARTPHLLPAYNALLMAARANHPEDVFLQALEPIENRGGEERREDGRRDRRDVPECGPEEMRVLFGQLYICMESFAEEAGEVLVAALPEKWAGWRGGEDAPTERMG